MKVSETIQIDSMFDLMDICGSLPKAELRKVHVDGVNGNLIEDDKYWHPKYRAVVNMATGETCQQTTVNYQVLNHADFISLVADSFINCGVEGHGKVDIVDDGDLVVAKILFDNVFLNEPGMGRNIQTGGCFVNSYNAKSAARGYASMLRMSCTNQLPFRKSLPLIEFSRNHSALTYNAMITDTTKRVENFVQVLSENTHILDGVMNKAIHTSVEFASQEDVIDTITSVIGVKSHAERIADELKNVTGDNLVVNSWEIYDAFTRYTSHEDTLSFNVRDRIELKAEEVLLRPMMPVSQGVQRD